MNRKNVMTLVMLTAFGTSAFAVGFLGSPTAELGQGKWSIGYDYSYSSQDTDKATGTFWFDDGINPPFSDVLRMKIKDFNLQRHYATIGYGLTEDWDIYVKLGIADLKGFKHDYDSASARWGINFDNDFAWGWGTRYTFAKQDSIMWGATIQMNWLDTKSKPTINGEKFKWNIDSYDLLMAVGPTFDFGGVKVYGGPYYYYLNGDYELKVWDVAGALFYTESADIRADSNWGGFIGSVIDLGQNCKWTVEYNTTGKGWGLGTGIAWTF